MLAEAGISMEEAKDLIAQHVADLKTAQPHGRLKKSEQTGKTEAEKRNRNGNKTENRNGNTGGDTNGGNI